MKMNSLVALAAAITASPLLSEILSSISTVNAIRIAKKTKLARKGWGWGSGKKAPVDTDFLRMEVLSINPKLANSFSFTVPDNNGNNPAETMGERTVVFTQEQIENGEGASISWLPGSQNKYWWTVYGSADANPNFNDWQNMDGLHMYRAFDYGLTKQKAGKKTIESYNKAPTDWSHSTWDNNVNVRHSSANWAMVSTPPQPAKSPKFEQTCARGAEKDLIGRCQFFGTHELNLAKLQWVDTQKAPLAHQNFMDDGNMQMTPALQARIQWASDLDVSKLSEDWMFLFELAGPKINGQETWFARLGLVKTVRKIQVSADDEPGQGPPEDEIKTLLHQN